VTYTVEFEPSGIRLVCEEPLTISDAARHAGVTVRSECGGKGTCGKCLVRVPDGKLSPVTKAEEELLTSDQLAEGWRLACRTVVSDDVSVYVPAISTIEAPVLQLESLDVELKPETSIRAVSLTVPEASLTDQRSDLQRIAEALQQQHGIANARADLPALSAIREALREGDWKIGVALRGEEIIDAYPGTARMPVGLAVDVGTTKLACYLVDLGTGKVLAARGEMNPQIAYGEDVMSRLAAAMDDPADALRMQQMVVQAINSVASELCTTLKLEARHLTDACLVGNTAMHNLLLGLPVRPLALSPFVPATSSPLEIDAATIGLDAAPGAHAYLPPPIAGFVGSDHVAVLLAAGFGEDSRTRLVIDIGTNTEIALRAGSRIVSCSTASGPAFEGAHISHGMRAAPGAIQRVTITTEGVVQSDVIGGGPAAGICGSGVLDAVAEMRSAGIINERGRIGKGQPGVRLQQDGFPAFLLVAGSDGQRDVLITQQDIDQVLLAKGAIRAGIDILMAHLRVNVQDIEDINIAGAFGSYLDPWNAVRIGVLPGVPLNRIHAIGNAAGAGARMMLASTDARQRAAMLAKQVEYLEVTVYPGFKKFLAGGMRLPSV
jgi:uncharacterized 2Fe-2S/4Fe-4S cluster protein (DUF4445 family)